MAGSAEWMTPPKIVELAREVLGVIDLDPASSDAAQEIVVAVNYFTKQRDGLKFEWHGRVFMNPPYSRGVIDQFVRKLVQSHHVTGWVAILNNVTETHAGQLLLASADLVCFPKGRLAFLGPDGSPVNNNNKGQMIFYRGMRTRVFRNVFSGIGVVR